MRNKSTGFLLILFGAILFAYKSSWVPFDSFFTWPFALFIGGAILVFLAFLHTIPIFALMGGILASLGISIWGSTYVMGWPKHWSILAVLFGFSFLLQFCINRHTISAVIGSTLLISGILTWPGIREIPGFAPVVNAFSMYWPILLIGLGILCMRK